MMRTCLHLCEFTLDDFNLKQRQNKKKNVKQANALELIFCCC